VVTINLSDHAMVRGTLPRFLLAKLCPGEDTEVDPVITKVKKRLAAGTYRPLGKRDSALIRDFYAERAEKEGFPIFPKGPRRVLLRDGSVLATRYERIVVGDFGPYLEFRPEHVVAELTVKNGEGWRLTKGLENRKFYPLKYEWWETQLGDMVYKQRGTVKYADYRVGMMYVGLQCVNLESE